MNSSEIKNLEEKIQLARFYEDPYGFAAFYELLYGRELPAHAFEWIKKVYNAMWNKKGVVIEAFRGSSKTTTVTVAHTVFQVGHNPWDSTIFIQASDESAEKKAQEVAGLIRDNPGFRQVFPWVKPDEKVSWASRGYEVVSEMQKVKDDSPAGFSYQPIGYEDFRRLKASITQDPTFVGLGLGSTAIIGKHPTGMLVLDDIHDEKNTKSPRELETVKSILESTILPITTTPSGGTRFVIVIGTPWKPNDAFATLKAKPYFDHAFTPIVDKNNRLAWPEAFDHEWIENKKSNTPPIEWARMYLLDLTAAEGIHLKEEWLHTFPYAEIKQEWPVVMGIDYASTADQWETKGKERDYFALAICRLKPGGGIILVDGIREHMSQGEAELRTKAIAKMYPTLQLVAVEALGKGEEFYHLLLRRSKLPIMPMRTNKGKGERFERQMAPLFQFGRAFIADAPNEFLNHFRAEWLQFPQGIHDDTLDAAYWAIDAGKFNAYGVTDETEMNVMNPMFPKTTKHRNPAVLFGRR